MRAPVEDDIDVYSGHVVLLLWSLFYMASGINLLYAISRWTNLINACVSTNLFTDNPSAKTSWIRPGEEPPVTIQICTYNEGAVVETTIQRACSVDWPLEKLTVHVLDDSTDPASCRVVERTVSKWKEAGVCIARLTRPTRVGYKAGSLQYHFSSVESEFIAHFVSCSSTVDRKRSAVPFRFLNSMR